MSGQAQLENIQVAHLQEIPSSTGGTALPRTPPSTIYSHGPGMRRTYRGVGDGEHHVCPIRAPLLHLQLGPQLAHSQHLPSDAPSVPLFILCCRVSVHPLGLQARDLPMRLSVCGVHRRTNGWPVLDSQLTLRGPTAPLQKLQVQGQDPGSGHGHLHPNFPLYLKTHFTKTDMRKTSALHTAGTKGESRTTHLPHPSLRACSGRVWPSPPSPAFPTSHLPIPRPPIPAPIQGSLIPPQLRKTLLKLLFPGVRGGGGFVRLCCLQCCNPLLSLTGCYNHPKEQTCSNNTCLLTSIHGC